MSPQFGGRRETPAAQFDALLEKSRHFAQALNSHREASALFLAAFIGLVIENRAVRVDQVMQFLHDQEHKYAHRSSAVGNAQRQLAGMVREVINTPGAAG